MLKPFKLIINLNVQLNDGFQCESRKTIGKVNENTEISLLIPEGDVKTQNSFLKKELKKLKFDFNEISDPFKFVEIGCINFAKTELEEMLRLKNPISYIHNRRPISIFQTEIL